MTDVIPETIDAPITLRRELCAQGLTDRQIAACVRRGELARVRHGAYTSGATWSEADGAERHRLTTRAVLRQAGTDLVVSHRSALLEYGGPTWPGTPTHVDVTRRDGHAGRRHAGVRQHQGVLLPGDVVNRAGLRLTSATRTAVDLTTVLSTEASLVAVNHLLHEGLTTLAEIENRYVSMHHHPFTLRTDLVLRLADPRVESVGESRTFFLMWRQGLPCPIPQLEVHDDRGILVAALDFALPDHRVWIEFDGRQKYVKYVREGETVTDVVVREKQREDLVRELTGWRCVRITWADLRHPDLVAHRIRSAIAAA